MTFSIYSILLQQIDEEEKEKKARSSSANATKNAEKNEASTFSENELEESEDGKAYIVNVKCDAPARTKLKLTLAGGCLLHLLEEDTERHHTNDHRLRLPSLFDAALVRAERTPLGVRVTLPKSYSAG